MNSLILCVHKLHAFERHISISAFHKQSEIALSFFSSSSSQYRHYKSFVRATVRYRNRKISIVYSTLFIITSDQSALAFSQTLQIPFYSLKISTDCLMSHGSYATIFSFKTESFSFQFN